MSRRHRSTPRSPLRKWELARAVGSCDWCLAGIRPGDPALFGRVPPGWPRRTRQCVECAARAGLHPPEGMAARGGRRDDEDQPWPRRRPWTKRRHRSAR